MLPTAQRGALPETGKHLLSFLKNFDFVSNKVEDSAAVKTSSGGFVTIFVAILVILLAINEIGLWYSPQTDSLLLVDVSRGEKLKIHLDITFPALPCSDLTLDAVDSTGEQQNEIAHHIVKKRLDQNGRPFAHQKQEQLGSRSVVTFRPPSYCGSCYGAEKKPGQCCNSCEELKAAFEAAGRSPQLAESSEQCIGEQPDKRLTKEGCNIQGFLEVNKVKGEFHVAAGHSMTQSHVDHQHHVHRFSSSDLLNFNASHIVNSLSFGAEFPGQVNPLDNLIFVQKDLTVVNYFIKVVPTDYVTGGGSVITSCLYSFTAHQKQIDDRQLQFQLPGVFFKYEPSPLRIKYTERRRPFAHLLVRLCAVVGCVYVVLGLIYKLMLPLFSFVFGGLSTPATPER